MDLKKDIIPRIWFYRLMKLLAIAIEKAIPIQQEQELTV